MATTRQFAYNPTQSPIAGTTQVGDIVVGASSIDFSDNYGGVTWWMGPDEDLGYVVAYEVPTQDRSTPIGPIGTVRFWRTKAKTDNDFLNLVRYVSSKNGGPPLADVSAAASWLSTEGFWTSYVVSVGVTFSQTFVGGQAPGATVENAWTTFRNQLTGSYTNMVISNNLGTSLTVTDIKVQDIANALRTATTGTNFSTVIGTTTWRVLHGCVSGTPDSNSIYLTSSGTCDCGGGSTYTVRPMIKNSNWGGLNGSSCGQPTQVITVTFS